MVLGLILGGAAFSFGIKRGFNDIINISKERQLKKGNINTGDLQTMIHFAGLDKQGYPSDGAHVIADMVRRDPNRTEADARRMAEAYDRKVNRPQNRSWEGEELLKVWHNHIQESAEKYDYNEYEIILRKKLWTQSTSDVRKLYNTMISHPILKQYVHKEVDITFFEGDLVPTASWSFKIYDYSYNSPSIKRNAEKIFEDACLIASVPYEKNSKVIYNRTSFGSKSEASNIDEFLEARKRGEVYPAF